MGSGIVQVAAQAGFKVTMVDMNEKALANGLDIIAKSLPRVAKKQSPDNIQSFVANAQANITTTTDRLRAVSDADLVIEAVVENLGLKQELFSALDKAAPAHTIFASNTSSMLVTDIAATVSAERKTRFGGMHFFNRTWACVWLPTS